jgi:spermidine synthase
MNQFVSRAIFSSLLALSTLSHAEEGWYVETLYPEWTQHFRMDTVIDVTATGLQDLVIFENARFGRVLALDGIIQCTQADEYVYHEMLAHVPLIAHGKAKNVLIIGGGDGGMLREVSRHREVERIVLVEIDNSVIEMSKEYLPMLSQGAFEDPRLELVIADGAEYVKNTADRFDVIICDSPDPIGPAEVLFTEEFYGDCKRALNEQGIFVNQNGVPFTQDFEARETYLRRKPHFKDTGFFVAPVPTYVGGFMAFGWATDHRNYRQLSVDEIHERLKNVKGELKYYNAEMHRAAFALPNFIKNHIPQD